MSCGTYVEAKYTSMTNFSIKNFADSIQIPNQVDPSKYHTTIVYSTKEIDWNCAKNLDEWARAINLEVWPTRIGTHCLVMRVHSFYLHDRFHLSMAMGATYDFDSYKPHVTLSYDVGSDYVIPQHHIPQFPLIIDREEKDVLRS